MPDENIRLVHASGECEIDLVRRELRILGAPVPVGGRAFEVIEVLARSAGELVTKNQLIDRIWPGAIVSDNTLQVHAMAVRKALGQFRTLLKTESGRGYRLLGDWSVRRHDAARSPAGMQRLRVEGESPVTNFPATVTHLIGRRPAVARLRDLMSAYRVVTLTGPGGIGKTSLAMKAARGILGEFADGGWLAELASLSDPALVLAALAAVLRLPPGRNSLTPEGIAHAIGDKKLLLVLDNCEQVIDAAATLAETLLGHCPHVTILATSRETLRIQGEYVYRVPPLEVPAVVEAAPDQILGCSAVQLFVTRIKALDSDFAPNAETFRVIGAICRRLDGIPLAIEFAAARAATLGVDLVAAGLRDRFALLNRGRRTALPRHQTLRATLDWSHDLLPETERLLLRRLAVFPAGLTLDAAAAVTTERGPDAVAVTDGIANLVAKSLVMQDPSTAVGNWYLLETTRAYALQKLHESGEADALGRRHATYCRAVFEHAETEWETRSATEWLADYGWQIHNLRAALEWAFSAGGEASIGAALAASAVPLWMHLSLLDECANWMMTAMNAFPPELLGTRQEMAVQLALGYATMVTRGLNGEARAALERANQLGKALGDLDYQLRSLTNLVVFSRMLADFSSAVSFSRQLDAIAQEIADPLALATADCLLASTLVWVGQYAEARTRAELALRRGDAELRRAHRIRLGYDHWMNSRSLLTLILWVQGFPQQASQQLNDVLIDAEQMSHPFTLAYALNTAGCLVPLWTGDLATAQARIMRLKQYAQSHALESYYAAGLGYEGLLAAARGDAATGVQLVRAALAELNKTGFYLYYMVLLSGLAQLLARSGAFEEAAAAADEVVARAEQGNNLWWLPEALRVKGEVLLAADPANSAEAEGVLRRALDLAGRQGALSWQLRAATSLSRLRRDQGRPADARALLVPVYGRFTEGFATADLVAARLLNDE